MSKYLLTLETVFCDYEQDESIRQKFLPPFLMSLESLARLRVPDEVDARYLIYLSADKTSEIEVVKKQIASFPAGQRERFVLTYYEHPAEGYGYSSSDHVDLYKNPNKVAPRRDALFEKAIAGLDTGAYERVIRMALDDDDVLLPWQLEEIVRAAEKTYDPQKIVATGLPNSVIAYIGAGEADVVDFDRNVNGNKFYVSASDQFEKQRTLSPWSIPENFDASNIVRMAKAGVVLKKVVDNIPGFIYMRWGHNLSLHDKSVYYNSRFEEVNFSSVADLLSQLEKNLPAFSPHGRGSTGAVRVYAGEPAETFLFHLPEALSTEEGEYVAIFLDSSGQVLVAKKLERGKYYSTKHVQSTRPIGRSDVAFIQIRRPDGSREAITPRDRLSRIDELRQVSPDLLTSNAQRVDPVALERISHAVKMASWIGQEESPISPGESLLSALSESGQAESDYEHSVFQSLLASNPELRASFSFAELDRVLKTFAGVSAPEESRQQRTSEGSYEWTSVAEFCGSATILPGRHRLWEGGVPIDLQLKDRGNKNLVVFLHGRKADKVKLPYLAGSGITEALQENHLAISDPSLYLDPENTIGWFAGSHKQLDLQKQLADIITRCARELEAQRVVLVGGSAGGFASLVLSRIIPDSMAVVWNPQTNIFNYYKRFVDHYVESAWQNSEAQCREHSVVDVAQLYAATTSTNSVLYLQETTDAHHVEHHLAKVREVFSSEPSAYLLEGHWGEGHAPVPKLRLVEVLQAALTEHWQDKVKLLGFVPFRPAS